MKLGALSFRVVTLSAVEGDSREILSKTIINENISTALDVTEVFTLSIYTFAIFRIMFPKMNRWNGSTEYQYNLPNKPLGRKVAVW